MAPAEIAPTIRAKRTHSQPLRETDLEAIFRFYRGASVLRQTDAFVCMFPTAFCEAYMAFNRTILWYAGHRFALHRRRSGVALAGDGLDLAPPIPPLPQLLPRLTEGAELFDAVTLRSQLLGPKS